MFKVSQTRERLMPTTLTRFFRLVCPANTETKDFDMKNNSARHAQKAALASSATGDAAIRNFNAAPWLPQILFGKP